jgi:hypothetical protein
MVQHAVRLLISRFLSMVTVAKRPGWQRAQQEIAAAPNTLGSAIPRSPAVMELKE